MPIIACTAFVARDVVDKCLESGMCDYLAKPLNFEKIERIIKQYGWFYFLF